MSGDGIYRIECVLIALVASASALWLLVGVLRRSRQDLRIGRPVAIAFVVRLLATVAVGQLSIAQTLRGGDELTFLRRAEGLATLPLGGDESLEKLTGELHTFLFSLHERLFEPAVPTLMLRVEMIFFSVVGLTLIAAAVYELAGARAAAITAWILALEPANVFFSGLLHKEPLMFLAEGAVAYGGAVFWKRGNLAALVPIVLGCLVATATRPYAGWFLAAAAAVVVLHASITRQEGVRALVLTAVTLGLMGAFVPVVWDASSDENLEQLQQSQDANAANEEANLSLEHVDYSTREKLITNLPQRLGDVIFKPYPWQSQNTSQRLGILGTFVMLVTLVLLVGAGARRGSALMQRAGPLVYPAVFMLVAYSLSAGNAGTAFRYRTHVVALAVALVIILREHRREEQTAASPARHPTWQSPDTAPTLAR